MQRRRIYFILIVFVSILFSQNYVFSQSREVGQKQKKSAKMKLKQKKEIEKAQDKKRKKHYKLQTDEVQKRMNASKKDANHFNKQTKSPFINRFRKHKYK